MDTVTHTLFGLSLYGAVNKEHMEPQQKRALLCCMIVGSQIPDIDVISAWWDTQGRYQMWHRGITHSIFLVPLWALVITWLSGLLFKIKRWQWYGLTALAVLIHDTSDIFNAWGTGYFEPLSAARLTNGTTPIVDVVFWLLMLLGFLVARFRWVKWPSHRIFQVVWLFIALHTMSQATQGALLYEQQRDNYDEVTIVADFIPTQFSIVGKKGNVVEMKYGNVFQGLQLRHTFVSDDNVDQQLVFRQNPRARTLVEWAPFVVWTEDEKRITVFDPRFYRGKASFLTEEYVK